MNKEIETLFKCIQAEHRETYGHFPAWEVVKFQIFV